MERFSVEPCNRGYHVYKDIWEASIGEHLLYHRENGNCADPFAVGVVKNQVTVGHIPRKISSVYSLFFMQKWQDKHLHHQMICLREVLKFPAYLALKELARRYRK